MNESALNALINLFAIFSIKGELEYDNGRKNLEEYLNHRLGIRDTREYISLFFELYELYSLSPILRSDEKIQNLIDQICHQLKSKIPHYEQVIVFLHFFELASGNDIDVDDQYYKLVGQIFEISEEDYSSFKKFIFCDSPATVDERGYLVINNQDSLNNRNVFHIQDLTLSGEILVYYVEDIKQFVFKYFGPDILFLEGNSIREGHFYTLNQGSIIRGQFKTSIYFSEISLKYFNYEQKNPLQFTANNVSYFFPGSKNGIQNFSFSESSGQMIAVMGGSGVGKSTLLNVLNGSLKPSSGSISINGFDIQKDYSRIDGLIGFIPQDDLVIGELTVYQNVLHNAKLCLDHQSTDEIQATVDKLLKDLDLFEIRDMVVGSPLKKTLSGGQRKRLNIALELVREPSILFVDEPTSGLSSRDSERIMILLKEQARHGRLVIVNIHQPSSFIYKLFDKLWVLDKGGYPIYAGNPLDAVIYFKELANHIDSDTCECPSCGNVNPEQVLDIIETNKIDASGKQTDDRRFVPDELYQLYQQNIQDKLELKDEEASRELEISFNRPGRFKQFRIFSLRNLQSKLSNRQYVFINLLQAPLLALVVSLLTRFSEAGGYEFGSNKNFPSFVFMSVVVMLFQGMSLSAEEIIRDRAILQRETFLRLSRSSYINSKVFFLILVSAIQSFFFIATSSLILGMNGLLLDYWFILFLTAVFANLAGLVISAGLNSVVTIYISIPLLIIPQILLCGLIVPFDDLKSNNSKNNFVPVVGDFMVSRWAFEALTVNQFINNKYTVLYYDFEKERAEYDNKDLIRKEISNLSSLVRYELAATGLSDLASQRLEIIKRELTELDSDNLQTPFPQELLTGENNFDEIDDSLQIHLDKLKSEYIRLKINLDKYKDNFTSNLVAEMGNEETLTLKRNHENSALRKLLSRSDQSGFIETRKERVFVLRDPIYRNPESNIGRAHFYAPFKSLGKFRLPTLSFNAIVIILMSLGLYIALYYNWLGNVLNGWQRIRSKIKV